MCKVSLSRLLISLWTVKPPKEKVAIKWTFWLWIRTRNNFRRDEWLCSLLPSVVLPALCLVLAAFLVLLEVIVLRHHLGGTDLFLFYFFNRNICVCKVSRGWRAGSYCGAFGLFMDSNRRHLKRTMKLLISVMGHLLNCFVQQLHNSIYVISFYFQQQLIMSHWLLVLISKVPWLLKVTFLGTFARKVSGTANSLYMLVLLLLVPHLFACVGVCRGWQYKERVGHVLINWIS